MKAEQLDFVSEIDSYIRIYIQASNHGKTLTKQ